MTKMDGTPTIHDVAREANVSVMTVSRSLNEPEKVASKTLKRIKQVIDELGYQPSHVARSLVKRKTNTIGIVMPDIRNTFFNSWFRSVEDYANKLGYATILLCNTDENSDSEIKFIKSFQSHRVDGIIIVPHSDESIRYLAGSGMNFVLVDRMCPEIESDFVVTDHYDGAFRLTNYLIRLGHKRIGVLRGAGVLFPDMERYAGFYDAMRANKIAVPRDLIRNCEFHEAEAYDVVLEMLGRKHRPTALFSFNCLMTSGAIRAIQKMKITIPDDISLAGYDEISGYDIFEPKITHVLQPIEKLGQIAVKVLVSRIEFPDHDRKCKTFLKPKLIIGNSCGRIV
ncbi:MAG TPA: LacI family DNA-binding transcriptional regulator [Candidatus Acidoferrales bacterium]|nr:LacI family DNA-binding transcriptional regulator [Candidatus Acidoferrales bacterium]